MLSNKMLVGITQRIDKVMDRAELRDALDHRVVQWLVKAGFLPVPVPNALQDAYELRMPTLDSWLQSVRPSALILSGGNDIGEYPERDATERYLLSWAEIKRLPVLGICRGLQMMAVWAGVDLVKVAGHVESRHHLSVNTQTGEWPTNVNSYHNWALASCPAGFKILAQAEDESIEAIQHTKLPWQGWMWHPEREVPFSPQDIKRLKGVFGE